MSASAVRPHHAPIIVTSAEEIAGLARHVGLFAKHNRNIRVDLGGLTPAENKALEADIIKHYSACGCGQGRISGIITLIGYLALVLTGVISVKTLGIGKTILLYFACATVAMIVGKAFALSKARRSLIALSEQFQTQKSTADAGRGG